MSTEENSEPTKNIYKIFLRWFARPEKSRDPRTVDGFCELFNITKAEIAEYQNRDGFYDDLVKEAKNWGKMKLPELMHTLYQQCIERKSPAAFKAFKELLEVDKEQKQVFNLNVFDVKDDSYRQIVAREARLLENGREKPLT